MGWNRPNGEQAIEVKRGGAGVRGAGARGALAAVLVVAGAVLSWFLLARGPAAPEADGGSVRKPGRPKAAEAPKQEVPGGPSLPAERAGKPGTAGATAGGGSAAEGEAATDGDAAKSEEKPVEEPGDRRVFKNMMDQLLAMAVPKNPGEPMPPLPIADGQRFPKEMEEKLFEQLVAEDGDSDDVLERKELVQSLRNEYFELKKKGWTFVDYLKALQAKVALDAEVLHESLKINATAFGDASLSDEKYNETLNEINKVLTDRGIPPIHPTLSGREEDEDGTPLPPGTKSPVTEESKGETR